MRSLKIAQATADPTYNLALDTIRIGKQALVFVGTRPSAEKTAEEIAKKVKAAPKECEKLALDVLESLSKPTVQCERLARCVKKGVAFHHSGLTREQKRTIEQAFRDGTIKIIACTPTLAAGLDLPAYRAVIRDLKRFGQRGMNWIAVLEYLQMAGRAGRPKYDTEGEAICIASTQSEADVITERYVQGEPEEIYSKLAVEPVLRVFVLSTIASQIANSTQAVRSFFAKTFWAHQFADERKLNAILDRIMKTLEEWEFIRMARGDFQSADELEDERVMATEIGRRVSELYLDPLTAHEFLEGLKKAKGTIPLFALAHLISFTLEMRPLLRVKSREHDTVQEALVRYHGVMLAEEPSLYEDEYDEFLNAAKTALFFEAWADEKDEEFLLETFSVRPGEIRAKLDIADWLLFSMHELARMKKKQALLKEIAKVRVRLRYGVREELLPLLRLRGVGRVRARKLFSRGIRDIGGVKKAPLEQMKSILGEKTAKDVKAQVSGLKKDAPQDTQSGIEDYEKLHE